MIRPDFDLGRLIDAIRPRPPREFRTPVRRPDDHLVFDLVFENLELKTGGTPRLGRLTVPRSMGGGARAADHVRILTRNQLARPRTDVEREILERLGWTVPAEKGDTPCNSAK